MIIVEGPDGGGKTTIVKVLTEWTGFPVMPRVVSKDTEAMTDLKKWVEEDNDRGTSLAIYDRHRLISEPIYSPILREEQTPGFTDWVWMAEQLGRLHRRMPLMVFCLPPLETVLENTLDDPDNIAVAHKMQAIYAAYVHRAAMEKSRWPSLTIIYDYTKDSIDVFNTWFPYLDQRIWEAGFSPRFRPLGSDAGDASRASDACPPFVRRPSRDDGR